MFNMETHLSRAGDKNTNIVLLFAITPLIMNSLATPYQGKTQNHLSEVGIV
jgi:hypothetical protein